VIFIILISHYLSLGACSFSPKIPDGTVRCRNNYDCPSGFACIKSAITDEIGICCSNARCDDKLIQITDANAHPSLNEVSNSGAWGGNLADHDTGRDHEMGDSHVDAMVKGGAIAIAGGSLADGGSLAQGGHGGRLTSSGGIANGGMIGMDAVQPTTGGNLELGGTPIVDAGRPRSGGAILLGGNSGTAGSIGGSITGGVISFGGNSGDSGILAPADVGMTVPVDSGTLVPVDVGMIVPVDSGITFPDSAILRFTATPSSVLLGQGATLDWNIKGPVHSLAIDQGMGSILGLDNLVVIPLVTTTYTLLLNGTESAQVIVKVKPLPIDLPIPGSEVLTSP
jgi:hypothetical protein